MSEVTVNLQHFDFYRNARFRIKWEGEDVAWENERWDRIDGITEPTEGATPERPLPGDPPACDVRQRHRSGSAVAWVAGMLALLAAGARAEPGDEWQSRSRFPQGNMLNAVAWSGSQFAAVGALGTIVTSPDGVAWTVRASGTEKVLTDIVWAADRFVAVGADRTVLTSSDGTAWTVAQADIPLSFAGIACDGTVLVGVAAGGATGRSVDGISWTQHATGYAQDLSGVAWGGGVFVAVGRNNNISTSPDGATWTQRFPPGAVQTLNAAVWAGDRWIVVGDEGAVHTSADGAVWTPQASGTGNTLTAAAWNGSVCVAVGGSGTIRTSSDGKSKERPVVGNCLHGPAGDDPEGGGLRLFRPSRPRFRMSGFLPTPVWPGRRASSGPARGGGPREAGRVPRRETHTCPAGHPRSRPRLWRMRAPRTHAGAPRSS